jgi:NAD(P)-dependent dehydrogenase (short-subunit alcohol dehydrogenase family)
MDNKKVWFITGASKGLGLSLVNQLLAAGGSGPTVLKQVSL